MKVNSRMICPVQNSDGTWKTKIKHFEEDIPDLGRDRMICNKCGWSTYPECKKWCPNARKDRARA